MNRINEFFSISHLISHGAAFWCSLIEENFPISDVSKVQLVFHPVQKWCRGQEEQVVHHPSGFRIQDPRPNHPMIRAFRNSDEETGVNASSNQRRVIVGKMFFMELVNFALLRDKGRRHHAKHTVPFFDLLKASTSVYLPYDLSTSRCRSISLSSERTNFPWSIPLSSSLPIEITPTSSRTRAHPFQVSPHSLRSCSCALRRKTGPSAGFFLGGSTIRISPSVS